LIENLEPLLIARTDAFSIFNVFQTLQALADAIHMKNLPLQFFEMLATSFYLGAQEGAYESLAEAIAYNVAGGTWTTPAQLANTFSIYVDSVKHSNDKYRAIAGFLRFFHATTGNRDWTFARKLELSKLLEKVRKFAKSCFNSETLTEPAYRLLKKRISELSRPFSFLNLVVPR
jgi:hypothetical protein